MSKWIDTTIEERKLMLQRVAESKKFADSAAEKDWWVTLTLKALFSLPISPYLLFKGGTSLSKGWGLISRFSEDIDLTLSQRFFIEKKQLPFAECRNNQQIKLLRKASRDFIVNELCVSLHESIEEIGVRDFELRPIITKRTADGTIVQIDHDSDPTLLELQYASITSSKQLYIQPVVKIEISCLGMDEPYEMRHIRSLVSDLFPDEDDEIQCDIPTVTPTRTFLEKVFLLNEEFQRANPRSIRMSRHLYDLERLMNTPFSASALKDKALYKSIVEHRKRFYHVGSVNYEKDMPHFVDIIPVGKLSESYKTDYENMLATYIYDRDNAPNYEELIARISELQERIRQIND